MTMRVFYAYDGMMLDANKAGYVIQYYKHLMTPQEWRAYGHLQTTAKLTYGRKVKAELEAGSSPHAIREHLSTDPEVLKLTSDFHAFGCELRKEFSMIAAMKSPSIIALDVGH